MHDIQQLARAIKEAKANFERECAHLPRLEVDRRWQRQLLELISSTTGSRLEPLRGNYRSVPTAFEGPRNIKDDHNARSSGMASSILPALEVTAVAPIENPMSPGPVARFLEAYRVVNPEKLPPFEAASPSELFSQRLAEERSVKASRKRKRSIDTISTFDLLPPPYALSDM